MSSSAAVLHQLIDEVQLYYEQARLLVAGSLLAGVDGYLASGQHGERAEVKAARALLEGELKTSFDVLRRRAAECRASFEDWQSVRVRSISRTPIHLSEYLLSSTLRHGPGGIMLSFSFRFFKCAKNGS